MLAFDIAKFHLQNSQKALQSALKLAMHLQIPSLAEKLNDLLRQKEDEKLQKLHQNNDFNGDIQDIAGMEMGDYNQSYTMHNSQSSKRNIRGLRQTTALQQRSTIQGSQNKR